MIALVRVLILATLPFACEKLNDAIGELARCYGATSVVALTEVMGCSSCATDSVERGASIRALVDA